MGHYHLWFIYLIIGLYFIIPLLRLWVTDDNKKYVEYFIGLSIVFAFIIPQITSIGMYYSSLFVYINDILEKYYEHHEILDAIAIDYQVAKQTIFRHKENALKMIAKRYASGIPLNTIFQMQKKHDKRIRESNNNIKVIFEMEKENKNEWGYLIRKTACESTD